MGQAAFNRAQNAQSRYAHWYAHDTHGRIDMWRSVRC